MRNSPGAPHSTERCKGTKKNTPIQANVPFFDAANSSKSNGFCEFKKKPFLILRSSSTWLFTAPSSHLTLFFVLYR